MYEDDLILVLEPDSEFTLVDDSPASLVGDTVTVSDVLAGKTFHDASFRQRTGECTFDADTRDATAGAPQILTGYSAYVNGEKVQGSYTLAAATQGTATVFDIKNGKTAWVNGIKLSGAYVARATMSTSSNVSMLRVKLPTGTYSSSSSKVVPYDNAINTYINSITSILATSNAYIIDSAGRTVTTVSNITRDNNSRSFSIKTYNTVVVGTSTEYYLRIGVTLSGSFIIATIT